MNLEDAADRDQALTVSCRWCHAEPGDLCRRGPDGAPLDRVAAHTQRLQDAGVVHAPIDPRELRGA